MLALVVASRFGMLFGLALWVGLSIARIVALPVIDRMVSPPQGRAVSAAVGARIDAFMYLAVVLVVVALGARVAIDRAAPPIGLIAPVVAMTAARLLSVVPLLATKAELRGYLGTLEVCLCLYALYAVS